ncbi:insecticyanin-A-like [Pectinophora gossypiella]|uniref:insecticyanin-A-like n=1 Tax=Pectinophora gossypiella TaxID=13191 RepID=UPI00214EA8BE|nr:insecticyanin-A-like [Pectinophora gossypiella]
MLLLSFVLGLCVFKAEAVLQNVSCPVPSPRELDLKELDGKWYMISIASEMEFQGDCAMVTFSHKNDNTTDVSISWINNTTASFYNGSVALSFDPNNNSTADGDILVVTYTDEKTESYSFLALDYEHYAVVFACYDNDDGNSSTYELWELSRTPHLKPKHVSKIYNALATYNLQDTPLLSFNNTEESCKVNSGNGVDPSCLILTSAAAIALFRRFY